MSYDLEDLKSKITTVFSGVKDALEGIDLESSANFEISTLLIFALALSLVGNLFFVSQDFIERGSSSELITAKEAGLETERMANQRILDPSPNNVSAEFVSASSASSEGLPDFYKVKLNVTNPSGSQITEVFTKNDGSLVFMQNPRYLDQSRFESDHYH